jgi:hypothetical protein
MNYKTFIGKNAKKPEILGEGEGENTYANVDEHIIKKYMNHLD